MVAAEARGFLLGPALALELDAGFVLARKPGKLPYETVSAEYLLEYGAGQLELHTDALAGGAAGAGPRRPARDRAGPRRALCELVEQLGGEVAGCGFLIELAFLGGRERLARRDVHALLALRRPKLAAMPTAARQPHDRRPGRAAVGASSATPTTCPAGGRA